MSDHILEMKNITKEFFGVKALNNVNLRVERGEIHAICGENGAGKSTLMKVLSGVYPKGDYTGEIILEGDVQDFERIRDSEDKGIVIIHQELALIPELSIAENIFLGNENATKGVIDYDMTVKKAKGLMDIVGLEEDAKTKIKEIGVGKQQLVEIAKAISKDVKILILDEPTAALNEDDSENLLNLLLEFKNQGITCIIISHKLNEVMAVSDNVTIIRDGQSIQTMNKERDHLTENMIIKGMVGRELDNRYPERQPNIGEKYFEVENWNVFHPTQESRQMIHDANFHIKKGEIVGIAGLMGSGRTEFAMSIFGGAYGNKISGTVKKEGKEISVKSVREAIANGLAYVSEDRKGNGLVLIEDINRNISMANLNKLAKNGVVDADAEIKVAEDYKEKMRIKSNDVFQTVNNLSGGNQQKVVLAKWMFTDPDILFLDEPTRGIDVGAKYEIYMIIQEMVNQGKAVCIISSELPELLGMCDRIYTMSDGHFTNVIPIETATQEILMENMTKEVGQ